MFWYLGLTKETSPRMFLCYHVQLECLHVDWSKIYFGDFFFVYHFGLANFKRVLVFYCPLRSKPYVAITNTI